MKKKVLLVTNMFPSTQKPYSGIFVKNQYERLNEILPYSWEIDIFYQKRQITNLYGTIAKYLNQIIRFVPVLFKKYDVIHLHFLYPLIFLVAVYKLFHPRVKLIVTYHGSDIHNLKKGRLSRIIKFIVVNYVNYNISVSESFANDIQNKLDVTPDIILPAGVDELIFKPKNIPKKYHLAFVGSLYHIKGIDLFCEAINLLKLENKISIIIVGTGEYLNKLELINSENINIKIIEGANHQFLSNVFNETNFLVAPSRKESFGLVVSEAMSCGTPCICSDINAFTEKVVDKENGYLFSAGKAIELSKSIQIALNISRVEYNNLSNNCRLSDSYTLTYVCKKLIEIYNLK